MRGYLAKADRRTADGAERSEARATRAGADAHPSDGAALANGSSKTASLMQLRSALDQSATVKSQLALQRALDQRAASGGLAPPNKKPARGKPALQKKGIAINDDAALEHEADVQGQKALT